MNPIKTLLILVLAIVVAVVITGVGYFIGTNKSTEQAQEQLQPFYDIPDPLPAAKPGTILRQEPMQLDTPVTGASAYRVLYYSAAPDGTPRISSGMIFVPTAPATGPRPIAAYSHGTVGLGPACAGSRQSTITNPDQDPWIQSWINYGWVVTATDYVGQGTAGQSYYLIGQSEAADVVNSVRAAQNFPNSGAGNRYVVMGDSQGGHAATWTGHLSKKIAPELDLLGVAAPAPAINLPSLISAQWDQVAGRALGPYLMVAYPAMYPNLSLNGVTTAQAQANYQANSQVCLITAIAENTLEADLGQSPPFTENPNNDPAWAQALKDQVPPPLPASMPTFFAGSVFDGLVQADVQAATVKEWCDAGSMLQMEWVGALASGAEAGLEDHVETVEVTWPMATTWMKERFDGVPPIKNCATPAPLLASSP